jgi:hypothetical protein
MSSKFTDKGDETWRNKEKIAKAYERIKHEGLCMISKFRPTVEVRDSNGKFKGRFNLKSIKVYKEANDMS